MSFHSCLQELRSALAPRRSRRDHGRPSSLRAATHRLNLEALEDRLLLSFTWGSTVPYDAFSLMAPEFAFVAPALGVSDDFNDDNKLDLFTVTYPVLEDGQVASVFLGRGDGTSVLEESWYYSSFVRGVGTGDIDGNGRPDLAIMYDDPYDGSLQVELGLNEGNWGWGPYLFLGDATVTEGDAGTTDATFTMSLAYASDADLTFTYATVDSSATAGSDYQATTGTLTILAGQTTGTISVPVKGDRVPELDETFLVSLSSSFKPDLIIGYATGTIVDDEPHISIAPSVSHTEGNAGQTSFAFDVTLSAASNVPVTVDWSTADATATATVGGDYQSASGTLTFAPGETSKTLSVLVNGDRVSESDESFVVNLSSPTNAAVVAGEGWATIVDDEPFLSIGDVSKKEGNIGLTAFAFTVSLSVAYDVPVTVAYATANGTATAGDYQAATGTLTIPAGQTSGTITVQVIGDRLPEPDEDFFVNLSNLNYGVITRGQGVATIVDDEPRISIGDVTRYEGRKNQKTQFTFTVTLSAAYDQAVTMSFQTVDGTATKGDGDYVARTGTLTFAAGETSKTITIVIQGDNRREPDETFYLDLFGNSSNSLFTKKRGIGTIRNDD